GEQIQRELAEKREGFRSLDERYAGELARWEGEEPALARQVEDLQGRLRLLRERLPRGTLSQFERIRERHQGGALAPVRLLDKADQLGRQPEQHRRHTE